MFFIDIESLRLRGLFVLIILTYDECLLLETGLSNRFLNPFDELKELWSVLLDIRKKFIKYIENRTIIY